MAAVRMKPFNHVRMTGMTERVTANRLPLNSLNRSSPAALFFNDYNTFLSRSCDFASQSKKCLKSRGFQNHPFASLAGWWLAAYPALEECHGPMVVNHRVRITEAFRDSAHRVYTHPSPREMRKTCLI